MPDNSLDEIAKGLYKFIATKEGERPDMLNPVNKEALKYMLKNNYLIQEECCSPQPTPEGDAWYKRK